MRFVGPVDDVRPYLASADLVVLPSYREGIPRVAMEAAAMGRPVAGYDIRGMREVIDPDLGCWPPGVTWPADRIVEALLGDPARRAELGEAAGSGWPPGSPRTWSSSGWLAVYDAVVESA